jgi:hypothetical protein
MTPTPPVGSFISVGADDGDPVIVIPSDNGSIARYGVALFIACWLGGWYFGFRSAASQLLSGNSPAGGFLAFWLGAWIIGGIFVLYYLFRLLRPPLPEKLRLKRSSLIYDSGVPPLQLSYGRYADRREAWKSLFPKRVIVEIDRAQLASLRLRETDSGNRLTVDVNASRLALATAASEIDREWLYQLLASRYSLPNALRAEVAG